MIEQTMSKDHLTLRLEVAEVLLREFVRGATSTSVSDDDWEELVDRTVNFLGNGLPKV